MADWCARRPGLVAEEARRACAPRRRRSTGSRSRSRRRSSRDRQTARGQRAAGVVSSCRGRRKSVTRVHPPARARTVRAAQKVVKAPARCYDRALSRREDVHEPAPQHSPHLPRLRGHSATDGPEASRAQRSPPRTPHEPDSARQCLLCGYTETPRTRACRRSRADARDGSRARRPGASGATRPQRSTPPRSVSRDCECEENRGSRRR